MGEKSEHASGLNDTKNRLEKTWHHQHHYYYISFQLKITSSEQNKKIINSAANLSTTLYNTSFKVIMYRFGFTKKWTQMETSHNFSHFSIGSNEPLQNFLVMPVVSPKWKYSLNFWGKFINFPLPFPTCFDCFHNESRWSKSFMIFSFLLIFSRRERAMGNFSWRIDRKMPNILSLVIQCNTSLRSACFSRPDLPWRF